MFCEIDPQLIKPPSNSQKKRWFRDSKAECDLFVWEDLNGKIKRFQFWHHEALVEWNENTDIKTGHVDQNSGAFVNYQSELYHLHQNLDDKILLVVKDLLNNKSIEENQSLTEVKNILHEISNRDI